MLFVHHSIIPVAGVPPLPPDGLGKFIRVDAFVPGPDNTVKSSHPQEDEGGNSVSISGVINSENIVSVFIPGVAGLTNPSLFKSVIRLSYIL